VFAVYNLITIIWEQEQVPDEWKKSVICQIINGTQNP